MATSKVGGKNNLNPKQKLFCEYYISEEFFCNGTKSYMKAYPDADYNTARTEASKYLTNPNILDYIDSLLVDMGLNDQRVDKELAKLILQDEEKPTKLNAIKEYNKLKQRITEKLQINAKIETNPLEKRFEELGI